jgi:hypothetical protein
MLDEMHEAKWPRASEHQLMVVNTKMYSRYAFQLAIMPAPHNNKHVSHLLAPFKRCFRLV